MLYRIMSDSDPIDSPSNFHLMIRDALESIPFKFLGLMFLSFIFLSSTLFVSRILSHFEGATDGGKPSSYGVIIQGIFLVIFGLMGDISIKYGIV